MRWPSPLGSRRTIRVTLNASDLDLGASGTLLLPTRNMVVAIGKITGVLYLLNRDNHGRVLHGEFRHETSSRKFQAVAPACCGGPGPVY